MEAKLKNMRNQIPGKDKKPEEYKKRKKKRRIKKRKIASFSTYPSTNMQGRAMLNCWLGTSMHGHVLILVNLILIKK
jgi:hypothetical protein